MVLELEDFGALEEGLLGLMWRGGGIYMSAGRQVT
jgi:hypothetical protein